MGLIERVGAVSSFSEKRISDAGLRRSVDENRSQSSAAPIFEVDFTSLARQGLFAPGLSPKKQILELRAIKRNLLKRVGLLHTANLNRRGTRRAVKRGNVILVTSSRPNEGKTFSSLNLALSFAFEDNQSVLLIDGDVLRPQIRSYFGLPKGPGLTECLTDEGLDVNSVVWRTNQGPLQILSEGQRPGGAAELFASNGATAFFANLAASIPDRLIIIDAPPMLATTEAFALAQSADEVAFVVEADSTPEPAATVALDELLDVNPNVSLILNRCLVPGGGAHYGSYEGYDRFSNYRSGETSDDPAFNPVSTGAPNAINSAVHKKSKSGLAKRPK